MGSIRRLLKDDARLRAVRENAVLRIHLANEGVSLPHGTQLRMEYNGAQYVGAIEGGVWSVEGKTFKSPSAAAGGVALTKKGTHTQLDGWEYWQVKRPGDHRWIELNSLRK